MEGYAGVTSARETTPAPATVTRRNNGGTSTLAWGRLAVSTDAPDRLGEGHPASATDVKGEASSAAVAILSQVEAPPLVACERCTTPLCASRDRSSIGSSYGDGRPSRRCRAPDRDCPDEQRLPIRMGPVLKSPANVKPPWDWKGRLGNQAAFSIASQFTSTGGQQGPVYHGWKAATTTPRQPQGPTGRAVGQSCRGGRPAWLALLPIMVRDQPRWHMTRAHRGFLGRARGRATARQHHGDGLRIGHVGHSLPLAQNARLTSLTHLTDHIAPTLGL